MKKVLVLLISILTNLSISGQDITGQWYGALRVPGGELNVVFNITKSDSGYNATMDSPDQGAFGIPVTSASYVNSVLKLEILNAGIEYEGTLNKENIIIGNFKQAGQPFPLNLSREKTKRERTQTPKEPYPYYSQDVKFENKKEKIELAGTLTIPAKEGNYPVAIIISGSGPQNRDGEFSEHKPYLVLADYLTRNGIAVLRFDDRGIAGSQGDFGKATSLDFASDVESAIEYLKTRTEINKNKIGLIGHSEGGIIAPMVATKTKDVSFIVLMAGPGIPIDQLLLLQQELLGKVSGKSETLLQTELNIFKEIYSLITKSINVESLKTDMTNYFNTISETDKKVVFGAANEVDLIGYLTSPWMQYFVKYNPSINLEKVTCPVLAIGGTKDLQVPAQVNLEAIKKALEKGGNKNFTTKELPGLNHLFQECESGSPNEYAKIDQTFSTIALEEITNWILKQVK